MGIEIEAAKSWGYSEDQITIHAMGTGLINTTFLLTENVDGQKFVLQLINKSVFKQPNIISKNVKIVGDYLKNTAPDYFFIFPVPTLKNEEMALVDGEYWRLTPYISDAVAFDVLSNPKQAFEAAKQFGKLTRLLDSCSIEGIEPTIPHFHDLGFRVKQFENALDEASKERKELAHDCIQAALNHKHILKYYQSFEHSKNLKDRIIHHDTKISNVLLKEQTFEGVCVIDMDTLMVGKFISDLGDMMRTYLCAFSENEADLSKIQIRIDYFEAMIKGYLSEVKSILTDTEKDLILYAGKFMIYMQALRFLTDFLNGSIYYPTSYAHQNLDRAANQFKLLSEMYLHEKVLQGIIDKNL